MPGAAYAIFESGGIEYRWRARGESPDGRVGAPASCEEDTWEPVHFPE